MDATIGTLACMTSSKIEPKDIKALVHAIERLYLDKTLREQLTQKALSDTKLFSPEKMAERYEALYAEVLG